MINYILYLIKILKKYLIKVIIFNNDITLILNNENNLLIVSKILKNHSYFNYKLIQDITVIDYPNKIDRFQLVYNFLSIKRNFRLIIKFNLNEFKSINSLTNSYKSANWLERECWDMFGIYFKNHVDLRRILTDYGFENFPLRKDFPLNGYLEVRYDEEVKRVIYEPLEITQEFRFFNFKTPWNWQNK